MDPVKRPYKSPRSRRKTAGPACLVCGGATVKKGKTVELVYRDGVKVAERPAYLVHCSKCNQTYTTIQTSRGTWLLPHHWRVYRTRGFGPTCGACGSVMRRYGHSRSKRRNYYRCANLLCGRTVLRAPYIPPVCPACHWPMVSLGPVDSFRSTYRWQCKNAHCRRIVKRSWPRA